MRSPGRDVLMTVTCEACGNEFQRPISQVKYHHGKHGLRIFCSKKCAWNSRKTDIRTPEQKKADKKAYDIEYRAKNREARKVQKAAYYQATRDPEKEREIRKANMPRHIEYCRRPEYKAKKKEYDREHLAKKQYGPFAQAWMMLDDLKQEINSRVSRQDVYEAHGTQNHRQTRRRIYEGLNSN